ncbi:MAG TPA: 6-phosphofructokinase [Bacteroidia bacterium]|nr:6-phosphofructokinase [Bacteroidia bacterium]
MLMIKRIAVFTSGGDAPGMNACIRAVVRTGIHYNLEVFGILRGYEGMVHNEFVLMNTSSVANIIHHGGTMLKTARSESFLTKEGMLAAKNNLEKNKIDGVIAIGGDGTFRGALEFSKICSVPFIGCPGTIDNDLIGTDFTIGYDTAINTVVEAVDRIRDTAESHNRVFFVEVMGRDAGLIALRSGIAAGAEAILLPETATHIDELIRLLTEGRKEKSSKIVLIAEGDEAGGAFAIAEQVKKKIPSLDIRVTVLGHIQRGGNPTAMDRVNASRMGFASVEALLNGKASVMTGIINNEIVFTPFENAVKHIQQPDENLLRMIGILS